MQTRGAWLALALVGGAGCTLIFGDDLDKKQCRTRADCESAAAELGTPLVCRQHACQAPTCTESADCPAGSVCVQNLCVAGNSDAGAEPIACAQDSECPDASRCGFDGLCYEKWGCLAEDAQWPAAPASFRYTSKIRRIEAPNDPSAVGPLVITACSSGDPNCSTPTVQNEDVSYGPDVTVTIPFTGALPAGFVGAIRFTPPPAADGGAGYDFIPNYRHFTAETPLVGDVSAQDLVLLVGSPSLSVLASFVGVPADPSAGFVVVEVHDCGGRGAPGMSVAPLGAIDYTFVPISGLSTPLVGATETTNDGYALLMNLPPDRSQVFALRDEPQQRVITNTLSFIVYGGAINDVGYYPRASALQKWLTEARRQGLAGI